MNDDTARWLNESEDKTLPARIKAGLKERKTSMAAFARRCGCSPSWMSVVLRGGYPYAGAGAVPKYIWEAAHTWGLLKEPAE